MLIKISKGSSDTPPPPDQPAELLWTAEQGSDDAADVNQIPASVLSELAPTFVVSKWYLIQDAKNLLAGLDGSQENDVWTEVPVYASSLAVKGHASVPIQIRKHRAARMIFDSAIQFAENLTPEGAVWIRVE